jgi:hypothetical protein
MVARARSKRRAFHSDTPPLLAEAWLLAWGRIGGMVTIDCDLRIYPSFDPSEGCADRDCATVLLAEVIDTPGLADAVRKILAASKRARPQNPTSHMETDNVEG